MDRCAFWFQKKIKNMNWLKTYYFFCSGCVLSITVSSIIWVLFNILGTQTGLNIGHWSAVCNICLSLDPAVTGMLVLTSWGKAGCLQIWPTLTRTKRVCIKYVSCLPEDQMNALLRMKGCYRWWPLVSPKARCCELTHWYPRRRAMSDSSNGCVGSSKAYNAWAKCNLQNLGCSMFVDDVFTSVLNWYMSYFQWKSLIFLPLFFSLDFTQTCPEKWVLCISEQPCHQRRSHHCSHKNLKGFYKVYSDFFYTICFY